jgi:vacuolar-type H+-ATPase subunit E/Vma4
MSEPLNSTPEEGMVEKILADAQSEADRAIKNAGRSVEAERRKSEAEAEKARQEILERVRRKVEKLKSKETASAQIESKRLLLKAREQAISGILDRIGRELQAVREDRSRYTRALSRLATEAVAAVDLPQVVLRLAPQDAALLEESFAREVTADVKALAGKDIEIRVETGTEDGLASGGCIAASEDGRIIFDNTFKRRLERMRPELRSMIVKEVLKD